MDCKKWYKSRLIMTGAVAILGAVSDGLISGLGWRQILIAAIGALVVLLRTDTTTKIKK